MTGFFPSVLKTAKVVMVFRWGTHLSMSLFPSVHLCPSVCCPPYLRDCTSSDNNFWYAYVK